LGAPAAGSRCSLGCSSSCRSSRWGHLAAGGGACLGQGALGGEVRGARWNRRAYARPGLTAAQETKDASFDFKFVSSITELDRRFIEFSVLGIVDLTRPFVVCGILFHVQQCHDAQSGARLLGGIGIVLVDPAGGLFPGYGPPHAATAFSNTNMRDAVLDLPIAGRISCKCGSQPCRKQACRKKDSAICKSTRSNAWALQHV
jgi:hypothetical protein